MMCTSSWKWAVLVLSVAALVAAGCAKKQTVKSESSQGAPGAAEAPASAPAPGAVGEAPVKEAPPAPVEVAPATPPAAAPSAAAPGVAVTEEKPSQFDDVRFDFDKSVVKEGGRKTCQVVADFLKKNPGSRIVAMSFCEPRSW